MNTRSQLTGVLLGFLCAIGWADVQAAKGAQTGERQTAADTAAVTTAPATLPPPGGATTRLEPPDTAPSPVRGALPPRTSAERVIRPTEPLVQGRLKTTLQLGKPDYAISLDSQQEYNNTAMSWTFRIVNNGKMAPDGSGATASGGTDWYSNLKGGSKSPSMAPAKLVISVGKPCPQPTTWQPMESMPLPLLQPGASVVVPQGRYKMPDTYAGQGCRFRAEIVGPAGDANPSNNATQMITKTAQMPDLVLELDVSQLSDSGGVLVIRNAGSAPAAPSKAVYQCETSNPEVVCGHISEPWKPQALIEYKVPGLKPGQRHELKGLTPKAGSAASWKARADVYYEVVESNEGNNTLSGPKK